MKEINGEMLIKDLISDPGMFFDLGKSYDLLQA
jgi:hypothetical protein